MAGNRVLSIIGARTKNLLILEEEMAKVSDFLRVSTDDGSYGYHGFVSDASQDLLDQGTHIDLVVAIGPVPMMRVVCNVTRNRNLKTVVSLNPIMVDATGMCGACRVTWGAEPALSAWTGRNLTATRSTLPSWSSAREPICPRRNKSLETFQHAGGACGGGKR